MTTAVMLAMASASEVRSQTNNLLIYEDSLVNGFQDWSFAPHDLINTSPVHSGGFSISVTASPFKGLYLRSPAPIDTTDYSSLSFWAHGGEEGGQSLMIRSVVGGQVQEGYVLPVLPPHQWKRLAVPLAALSAANKTNFQGFELQLCPGVSNVFYVDDIQLDAKPQPAVEAAHTAQPAAPVLPPVTPGASQPAMPIAPGPDHTTWWMAGSLVVIIALLGSLVLLFWRRGPVAAGVPAMISTLPATQGVVEPASVEEWKQRAMAAEAMAGKQGEILREKIMPELTEFAKQSLVQGLYTQRNSLLETQQKAQLALADLESRLASLQLPLQERIRAYEKRIAELEKEVVTQGEEMRELTRATLMLVRKKLEDERASERPHSRFN
ncbi:MAG: hypothetical protein WAO02_12085 [Verrucomicrobiia bacterium]